MQHYIDLNEQYVRMNANNFKQAETDYSVLMGPPETVAPSVHDSPNLDGRFVCFYIQWIYQIVSYTAAPTVLDKSELGSELDKDVADKKVEKLT